MLPVVTVVAKGLLIQLILGRNSPQELFSQRKNNFTAFEVQFQVSSKKAVPACGPRTLQCSPRLYPFLWFLYLISYEIACCYLVEVP